MRLIYNCAEWHTRPLSELWPTCKNLRPKEDQLQVGSLASEISTTIFLWLKWSRSLPTSMASRPAYCKYSGVTYDFMVSNTGGTYDLADQIPSNHEICHFLVVSKSLALQWRHNGHDSISNHQPHDCLLNRLFRCRSKKISKLRVTGLCAGNSPGTGEFPAQMASNTENDSIWWHHHGKSEVKLA